ncbi:hypothetical protein CTI12_AA050290 [Artemisia annua]|uniref:Actin n=1 Tax=Artemisia annua TaxID=35608 RepID=A0A2U1QBV3_ARTAN|nr:hypothetical protein CTI12_AA050290 [Artemisia annua]
MDEYDCVPIVLDTGSGMIKAGFAGDDAPRAVFPSIVGKAGDQEDYVVGDAALVFGGHMVWSHPIEHGIVTNWDQMEKIWEHTFYKELLVKPEEHPVLFTEAALTPRRNRELSIQTMFETFNIPATFVAMTPLLSLYESGRVTGIVLESGHGVSQAIPIYEGDVLKHAIQRIKLAGADITNYLMKILMERNYRFIGAAQLDIVRDIKEMLAYVALDYEQQLETEDDVEKNYELPDGQVITIGQERFRCTEILFQPSIIGLDVDGIHDAIYNSIMMVKDGYKMREMFENIVLSGGSTMFAGIKDRLTKEMMGKANASMRVSVKADKYRKYRAWFGGSFISSLSTFQEVNCLGPNYMASEFRLQCTSVI